MHTKLTVLQARKLAGLTQEAAAQRASIGLSAYAKIETGRRLPRPATRAQIAHALGLSLHEIAWGKSQEVERAGSAEARAARARQVARALRQIAERARTRSILQEE
jgi:transcriptional regulator with XRE-family HTH domain